MFLQDYAAIEGRERGRRSGDRFDGGGVSGSDAVVAVCAHRSVDNLYTVCTAHLCCVIDDDAVSYYCVLLLLLRLLLCYCTRDTLMRFPALRGFRRRA